MEVLLIATMISFYDLCIYLLECALPSVSFQLLDFVSMNAASRKYNIVKQEGGWHRIAWAFLKVS